MMIISRFNYIQWYIKKYSFFYFIKSYARMLLIDDHVCEDSIAKMSKK